MSQAELLSPSPVVPSFPPLSYQGVPVLTTEMLAQAYEVEAKRIRQNFANNRERFVEGKHFFIITSGELKEFRLQVENFDSQISPKVRALTLWTERGAARNAKMLDSDRAWDVFELLEETFFRVVRPDPAPTPDDFTGTLSITPEQQCTLHEIVRAKVEVFPKNQRPSLYAQAWSRFNTHFRLAKYCQLQREKVSEAITYLTRMELAVPVSSVNPAPAPAKALPPQPERLPLYRNGCFYPPHRDRRHVPGPQEAALLELWQDWTRREAGLRQEFMAMLRELDARRGDLFSYAVSDLGRNADTMFSPQCLLDSLFQSRTEAEQRFRQALDDTSLHLRLSLNIAVALGR